MRGDIDGNIRYIETFVREHLPDAEVIACEGTYLVWLDVRGYAADEKKLEEAMLHKARVVLDEGNIFGEEGIGFERINAAAPRLVIAECMNRMKEGLESLRDTF